MGLKSKFDSRPQGFTIYLGGDPGGTGPCLVESTAPDPPRITQSRSPSTQDQCWVSPTVIRMVKTITSVGTHHSLVMEIGLSISHQQTAVAIAADTKPKSTHQKKNGNRDTIEIQKMFSSKKFWMLCPNLATK